MGMQTAPAQLFYDFCLDDHVPGDHLLRRIDRFLDLEKVRAELKPFYSNIGRPSIDPELMMRMLIVGYCMGIRSERRLCEEIHLNLAYRWFCDLGCESARGPDADRRAKPLIYLAGMGSFLEAYSQLCGRHWTLRLIWTAEIAPGNMLCRRRHAV